MVEPGPISVVSARSVIFPPSLFSSFHVFVVVVVVVLVIPA
jgi:hypothetical protein